MRYFLVFSFLLLGTPTFAQDAYTPPDKDLWASMAQAFASVAMPLAAHQQIQSIMANVQREAAARVRKTTPGQKDTAE